ncbi:MAG: hypothetical protein J3Q66DRAFT_152665 [Benniella sp.]|nr:MAG: hypothetical protein J3Q66DRAFT_152665 [Benniella sp.]
MGLKDWFPFLRRKGHDPPVLQQSTAGASLPDTTRRVDVLSFFAVIKSAYGNKPLVQAHTLLENHIAKLGTKDNLVLYVDGDQAVEKQHANTIREAAREKAVERCKQSLDTLEERIDNDRKVRKRHFTDVRASLSATFRWSFPDRKAFLSHMVQAGWTIRECETEADVAIAVDCQPNDVVISADSDMLAYASISTLWRPVSRDQFLVYKLPDVLRDLGLSRAQFTALAIVSSNDYNRNIYSLGPSTNHSIIKTLHGQDPRELVAMYMSHKEVATKNKKKEDFAFSTRVFADLKQTPVHTESDPAPPTNPHQRLKDRFQQVCSRFEEKKMQRQTIQQQSSSTKDDIIRLHSSKAPNRFKTVESPAPPPPSLSDSQVTEENTRTPRHRPRYSFRGRTQKIHHQPPPRMKKYTWKPHKAPPEPLAKPSNNPAKKPPRTKPIADGEMDKMTLVGGMSWEHPTITLDVGTLKANIQRVLPSGEGLWSEVDKCIQEAIQAATDVKRRAQNLIGMFIEKVSDPNKSKEIDRKLMDHLCERVKPKVQDSNVSVAEDGEKQKVENTDLGGKGDLQYEFLQSFLCHLYSGNYPKNTGVGKIVNDFIERLVELGLYSPRARSAINVTMPFTPSLLVRSSATQLAVELKNMYRKGCHEMHDKLQSKKEKGKLQAGVDFRIQENQSAIENFIRLNKLSGNPRKIVPMTSSMQPFISFSERELVAIFWKKEPLKSKLLQIASSDGVSGRALADMSNWIGCKEPGFLIKRLLVDVDPEGLTVRQRGKIGCRGQVKLLSLDDIREHLQALSRPDFNPSTYSRKGYVLRGSVVTDGHRIMLTAFKLRELEMVRYRRLPDNRLPDRITTTVGGGGLLDERDSERDQE